MFYDEVIAADSLPMKGNFLKKLYERKTHKIFGFFTELDPGDFGFYVGRWWIDGNGDGMMDEGNLYFSRPLIGPRREIP